MYPPPPPPPGYPPGYPGYQQPYMQAPYPQYQMRPQRSGIPRVLGILAIVFCGFGLGGSAIWTFGPLSDLEYAAPDVGPIRTWLYVWMALSFAIFVLHLIAGILAVQYKRAGLKLMTYYAIGAIALGVLDVILCYVLIPSHYHGNDSTEGVWFSVGTMHVIYEVMALPWPIVALALAQNAKAREACGGSMQQAVDAF